MYYGLLIQAAVVHLACMQMIISLKFSNHEGGTFFHGEDAILGILFGKCAARRSSGVCPTMQLDEIVWKGSCWAHIS